MTNSQKAILHVRERSITGKKSKQLHQQGFIPANVFGLNQESESIELQTAVFKKLLEVQGDTTLLYLQVGADKQIPTLIGEIQYNPVTDEPIHVSFKRVNLKVKVTSEISVETVGTFEVPDATVVLTRNMLEIEALPADLPEMFEVDISGLTEVGQTLHLSDVAFDRDKITVLLSEEELEAPIVIVQKVEKEVEETPAETTEGAETPAGEAAPAAEGETPATEEKKE
jgi:large subunit ribosomal protein L25